MNKGNLAKSLHHSVPPRTALREDKTTNFGGSHHVVENNGRCDGKFRLISSTSTGHSPGMREK